MVRENNAFTEYLKEWKTDVKEQLKDLANSLESLRDDSINKEECRERFEALRSRVESLEKFNARVLGILGFLQFAGMGVVWFFEWYFGKK